MSTHPIRPQAPTGPHLVIAIATSLIIVACAIFATKTTYRVAPAFLLPVTWGLYLLRHLNRLNLHPAHYAVLCSAILLHMAGAFGFYQRSPLPFSFDILVHFYFAFAITFPLHHFLLTRFGATLPVWKIAVTTFMFMMGLAALHEIMEYSSYLLLGEETGMLKPKTSYFFDTQRDLLNNLLGTLAALATYTLLTPKPARPADA